MIEDYDESIRLDQFLKLCGAAATGGQAKVLIQSGFVQVNGAAETRRRRQLRPGDRVLVEGETYFVTTDEQPIPPDLVEAAPTAPESRSSTS